MKKKITNAELIGKKDEIVDRNNNVVYDMFFVKVEYSDGSVRKVRTFSEPGTVDENNQADVRKFILSRLETIMEDSGRTNYLFLGRFLPDDKKYVADRFYETERGVAADVFENEVYDLRDAVEEMEREAKAEAAKSKTSELVKTLKSKGAYAEKNGNGDRKRLFPDTEEKPFVSKFPPREEEPHVRKFGGQKEKPARNGEEIHRARLLPLPNTYVLSDVHGFYGSYLEAMRSMTQFDTVYINGDVIDRGEDGIKIIEDIMRRTKHVNAGPKVKFMVGNHEMQMMKSIEIIESLGLNAMDIGNYLEVGRYSYYKNLHLAKAQKLEGRMNRSPEDRRTIQELHERAEVNDSRMRIAKKEADRSHKGVLESEARRLFIWVQLNGGMPTLRAYLNLPEERKKALKEFIRDSAVMVKLTENNKKHLLVHASPCKSAALLQRFEQHPFCELKYRAIEKDFNMMDQLLESRDNPDGFSMWKNAGYHTVYGHTPQKGFTVEDVANNAINIDAGCGHGGKLALYNLTENKTRYYEQRVDLEKKTETHDYR